MSGDLVPPCSWLPLLAASRAPQQGREPNAAVRRALYQQGHHPHPNIKIEIKELVFLRGDDPLWMKDNGMWNDGIAVLRVKGEAARTHAASLFTVSKLAAA
ncbi:hypothetical protein EJB05_31663, partial [Eragrostis curvula]